MKPMVIATFGGTIMSLNRCGAANALGENPKAIGFGSRHSASS